MNNRYLINNPISKRVIKSLSWFVILLSCGTANAQYTDHGEWSFSVLFGAHSPKLTALNNSVFKAPISGEGGIIIDEVTEEEAEKREFNFNEGLPTNSYGGKAAFELQWHANASHSLIFGVGSWEKDAVSQSTGEIPTQGELYTIDFERRAKISYAEYSLGWRYTFLKKKNFLMYTRSSFHEVFDIDYREDFVFTYPPRGVDAGFRRIRVIEAQTASLFVGQVAVGGEWFFLKWLALGMEAGYMLGESSVQLRDVNLLTDFLPRDNIGFSDSGSIAYYNDHDGLEETAPRLEAKKMKINFSGWQVMFRVNIYY